jgi:hypothetical protein
MTSAISLQDAPWKAVLGVPARVLPKFVLPNKVWTVSTLTSALLDGLRT